MGRGMARNLHKAGLLQAVWNRTTARAERTGRGARRRRGARPRRAGAMLRRRSCCASPRTPTCSTSSMRCCRDCGPARSSSTAPRSAPTRPARPRAGSPRRGVEFLDAPVSGGVEGARDGTLAIMVGGSAGRLRARRPGAARRWVAPSRTSARPARARRPRPPTRSCARASSRRSPKPWRSPRRRACRCDKLIETLGKGAGSSWYFVNRAPNIVRDAYPAGFRVRLHEKDLHICRDMAARLGVELPVVETTLEQYREADRAGPRRRGHLRAVPPEGRAVRGGRGRRHAANRDERTGAAPDDADASDFFLPDFCEAPRRARDRADRGAARLRARARAADRAGRVLDRPRAHLRLSCSGPACCAPALLCQARPWLAAQSLQRGIAWSLALMVGTVGAAVRGASTCSAACGPRGSASPSALLSRRGTGRSCCRTCSSPPSSARSRCATSTCAASGAARRARGAGAHPRAAGADPAALPVQQHEHDRGADALRPARAEEAIEDLADLFRVSLNDVARADHAARGTRDRAHLPAHRATAARRPAAGALGRRRRCRRVRSCRACCCNRCSRTRSATASSRCPRAAR